MEVKMRFWTFVQNNSFGRFAAGMPQYLIVEAESAEDANSRAVRAGAYFDGCDIDGNGDCPCCGDRWHAASGDGDERPSIYGDPAADFQQAYGRGWKHRDGTPVLIARVVYVDGRTEERDADGWRQIPARPRCTDCGSHHNVTHEPDPYMEEIYGDDTPAWLCDACRIRSARDV